MSDERKKQNWRVAPSRSAAPPPNRETLQVLEDVQEELRLIRMKDTGAVYDPTIRSRISLLIHKLNCQIAPDLVTPEGKQIPAKMTPEASAAPPSEREAAERIANEIVYSTANRELSPEQFKTFIMGIILHEFTMTKQACGHRTKHCCSKCKTCFACCQCEARAAVPQAAASKYVRLPQRVTGDWPFGHQTIAEPGIYEAHINPQGAVSVIASDGKELGVKPSEFEWVTGAAAVPQAAGDQVPILRRIEKLERRGGHDKETEDVLNSARAYIAARAAAVPAPGETEK